MKKALVISSYRVGIVITNLKYLVETFGKSTVRDIVGEKVRAMFTAKDKKGRECTIYCYNSEDPKTCQKWRVGGNREKRSAELAGEIFFTKFIADSDDDTPTVRSVEDEANDLYNQFTTGVDAAVLKAQEQIASAVATNMNKPEVKVKAEKVEKAPAKVETKVEAKAKPETKPAVKPTPAKDKPAVTGKRTAVTDLESVAKELAPLLGIKTLAKLTVKYGKGTVAIKSAATEGQPARNLLTINEVFRNTESGKLVMALNLNSLPFATTKVPAGVEKKQHQSYFKHSGLSVETVAEIVKLNF